MKYPCPTDIYRGMSPIQSLLADIDSVKYTAEWSRNFFLNSATPGGIVQFEKRLSDEEFDEFVDRWREQHQGVARGHRVGVLEQGAKWIASTYSMRDMQFTELRNLGRDVIREAYRIHQAMMGQSTDVNRANAQTAEEVHISWHEVPRLRRNRTVLNEFYLECFAETGKNVEFDFDDPNPASSDQVNDELTAKSAATKILVDLGFEPEDVLEVVGLPAMTYLGPPITPGGAPNGAPAVAQPAKAPRPARPPSEDRPNSNDPNDEDEFVNNATRTLRNLAGFDAEISDEQALAIAGIIRETVGGRRTNGHKELA
jgi:hypothetical protein